MRIARDLIDPDAEKVVRRLARHGHKAYLVGGCVRDLLLSRTPKDFDVATSATPKETKQLFRNCRIIGRRFRLAHIFFGGKIIETSTFRANPRQGEHEGELLIRRDNVFGSDTEDARRRDFTINGLFYDVEAEEVIDYVGGLDDLQARVVATIGNPDIRFQEDPVRMLRAIKFAARLDFSIAEESYQAILHRRSEITKCAQPRVLEELYRLLRSGAAKRSMELLVETGIAETLSPHLRKIFVGGDTDDEDNWAATWDGEDDGDQGGPKGGQQTASPPVAIPEGGASEVTGPAGHAWSILEHLDAEAKKGTYLSNALLLSATCAPFVVPRLLDPDLRPAEANDLVEAVLQPLTTQLQVARRDAEKCRQVLLAQRRLAPAKRRRGRPMAFVRRDYFDEALTVYEIFGQATGTAAPESAAYWRKLQSQEPSPGPNSRRPEKRRRRRRGGRRQRRPGSSSQEQESDKEPSGAAS